MKLFDNFLKALLCSLVLSFSSLIFETNLKIFIANFCVLFLGIFVFSTLYDIIKDKIKKIKEKRENGKIQGN